MFYLYFDTHNTLHKIAKTEEEKTNLAPFIKADNLIEKQVTAELFEKIELDEVCVSLVDGEIEEEIVTHSFLNPEKVQGEINRYLSHVDAHLNNYVNEDLSAFKTSLKNFTIPEEVITGEGEDAVSNYPISGNLVKLLRTNGITAYHVLNIR
tara:strand:- start:1060 stop:1515 length:456 start_codon:yes stop_codon:yes gene_type:complete